MGFDQTLVFKDEEGNREGMAKLMGLKTQVDVEKEIERRQADIQLKVKMLRYQQ